MTYEQTDGNGSVQAHLAAWKAKYGGLSVSEAQRVRQLEDENARLKKLVVNLSLDKEMLKAVISKTGGAREPTRRGQLFVRDLRRGPTQSLRAAGHCALEFSLPQ